MALKKAILEKAVAKYEPLVAEGKTEEVVKAEITKDEKGYDEEAVNEIYAALTTEAQPEVKKVKPVYKVTSRFRDKTDKKTWYEKGTDVSHFEADRLELLVKREMVKVE